MCHRVPTGPPPAVDLDLSAVGLHHGAVGIRGRVAAGLGSIFVMVGVATWAVELTVFEPTLSAFFHSWADVGGPNYGRFGSDDMEYLFAFGKSLRWASVLLGIAGARLVLGGSHWRGRLAVGLAVAWFGADVVLDRLGAAGWPAAVVAGVAGAAIVAAAVVLGRRHGGQPCDHRPSATVYSGALLGYVILATPPVAPELAPHVPAGVIGTSEAVTVALTIAALVTAVTSVGPVPRSRAVAAAVAAAVIGVALLIHLRLVGDPGSGYTLKTGLALWMLGAVPAMLALLTGTLSRGRTIALVFLAPVLGFVALFVALYSSMVGELVLVLTGDAVSEPGAYLAVGGFLSGALLGALAVFLRRASPIPADRDLDKRPAGPGNDPPMLAPSWPVT
jgi:hypothetical protein